MKQVEVKYAPGMRIIVRGEEWLVKKVETKYLTAKLQELVEEYALIEKFVCKYGMCLMNIKI